MIGQHDMNTSIEEAPPPKPVVAAPPSKTMLSYFTKLPSKAVVVEDVNPRKSAPAFNKQHVEVFQKTRQQQFDAELFNINNNVSNENKNINDFRSYGDEHVMEVEQPALGRLVNNKSNLNFFLNYLKAIKSGQHKPFKIDKKPKGPLRARLLQYHEDVRPPYYGTWQRKSNLIRGRRPFAQDENVFDYEVDSEAEWDIGGPGESLKGDDSEDDEELDDYEIDMKTFVPHGYVSDDEIEVLSDQDETPSANQSVDETCDVEDSNASVAIIGAMDSNGEPIEIKHNNTPKKPQHQRQQNQGQQPHRLKRINRESSPELQVQPARQKQDIKPISLGIYYEERANSLSESQIRFLQTFQGIAFKDC